MLSDLFASFASVPKTSTMYWATSEKEKKPRYFFTFGYNPFWWSILFSSLCITFTSWYEKKKYLLKRQVIPPTFKVIPTKIVLLHCLLESSELKNTIMLPSSNLMSTERDSLAWLIFCSTLNALLYGLSLMIYYQDFHFLNNFLSFSTLLPFWCK